MTDEKNMRVFKKLHTENRLLFNVTTYEIRARRHDDRRYKLLIKIRKIYSHFSGAYFSELRGLFVKLTSFFQKKIRINFG